MKAKKLKIQVKTGKFSIPLPALRFSTVRWISKLIFRYCPSKVVVGTHKSSENEIMENILKNITYDEKEGMVAVKIYTI